MLFQSTSRNARILAHCASVRLFPRVDPFVLLQIAWFNCSIVALLALMWFFTSVFHNVLFYMGKSVGRKVALCALLWFLSSVNEEVHLQSSILA